MKKINLNAYIKKLHREKRRNINPPLFLSRPHFKQEKNETAQCSKAPAKRR